VIKRLSHYFPLIIAALLAASTYWLEFVVRNERTGSAPSDQRAADAYVQKLELDRFDVMGRRQFHLVADEMTHYAYNDTADFVQPKILFSKDQRTFHLRSDRGHGVNNTQEVTLEGNVVGIRQVANAREAQQLVTESLLILVEDEIASTDKAVVATQGASRIDALGAEWSNTQGTLKLGPGQATLTGRSKQ